MTDLDDYKVGIAVTSGRDIISVVFFTKRQAQAFLLLFEHDGKTLAELAEHSSRLIKHYHSIKKYDALIGIRAETAGGVVTSDGGVTLRQLTTFVAAVETRNDYGTQLMIEVIKKIANGTAVNGQIYHPFLVAEGFPIPANAVG